MSCENDSSNQANAIIEPVSGPMTVMARMSVKQHPTLTPN